ncbi:MAG: hypothetical protein CL931_00495 [Deltaproteobacteria bacterium]|nr:hypothetical protein [Deltaproteobacteria bacterium]
MEQSLPPRLGARSVVGRERVEERVELSVAQDEFIDHEDRIASSRFVAIAGGLGQASSAPPREVSGKA